MIACQKKVQKNKNKIFPSYISSKVGVAWIDMAQH